MSVKDLRDLSLNGFYRANSLPLLAATAPFKERCIFKRLKGKRTHTAVIKKEEVVEETTRVNKRDAKSGEKSALKNANETLIQQRAPPAFVHNKDNNRT